MPVTFTPSPLTFITPGLKTQTLVTTVTNTESAAVTLSFGAGSSTDFTIPPTSVPAGATVAVSVSYRPTSAAGGSATLNASSEGAATPIASASLTGTATNPLTLAGNDFGTTTPGASVLGLVMVQNASDTGATLTGVVAPFVLSSAYTDVAAGAVIAVPVTFEPSAVGQWSATMTATVGAWSVTASLVGACATVASEVDSTAPPASAPPSSGGTTYQSYYIGVPSPASSLNLGYRRASTLKVDGLGVDTIGNAYVRVSEDIGVLANGATSTISMQSTTDTNLVAGGDFFVGATGATWLVGAAGISIATFDNSATTDSTTFMPTDDGIASAKAKINIASATFISLDVLVGAAGLAVATHGEVTSAKMFGEAAYGGWVTKTSKLMSVVGVAGAVALDIAAALSATIGTKAAPGVTIYGESGILAGTPGYASYYAGAGLVMGSMYPTVVGMDTAVMAMKDLSCVAVREAAFSGASTTVHGTDEVKVESVESVKLRTKKATEEGTMEVTPTSIELSSSKGAIETSLKMTSTTLGVETTDSITLDAGKTGSIVLEAGGWKLTISNAGIEITQPRVSAGPALTISKTAATLQASPTSSLKVTATDATLQTAGNSYKTSAAGVASKGTINNHG